MLLKNEDQLASAPRWHVIDALKSIEDIHREIVSIAEDTISRVSDKPIASLWI